MSNTHLDELLTKREHDACGELEEEIKEVQKVSTELKVDDKIPCYFNSGCCSFESLAITGLEIIEDKIQLIK